MINFPLAAMLGYRGTVKTTANQKCERCWTLPGTWPVPGWVRAFPEHGIAAEPRSARDLRGVRPDRDHRLSGCAQLIVRYPPTGDASGGI